VVQGDEDQKTAWDAVFSTNGIGGVSTRKVDDLVQAMGLTGISKSSVSNLCKDIDDRVHEFPDRPLTGAWPYLWSGSFTFGTLHWTSGTNAGRRAAVLVHDLVDSVAVLTLLVARDRRHRPAGRLPRKMPDFPNRGSVQKPG